MDSFNERTKYKVKLTKELYILLLFKKLNIVIMECGVGVIGVQYIKKINSH